MTIKPEHLPEIVYHLQGTCQGIDEALEAFEYTYEDLDLEASLYIDERIFCCGQCEWWFEIAEMSEEEEWVCEDCIKYG
jgi:hypothetical protein